MTCIEKSSPYHFPTNICPMFDSSGLIQAVALRFSCVRSVNLSGFRLTTEGLQALCSGLRFLKTLNIAQTQVHTLDPLAQSTNLVSLDAQSTNITNFDAIGFCTLLEDVDLSKTPARNISPLSKCTRLKTFKAEHCRHLQDLSALSLCPPPGPRGRKLFTCG